MKGRRARDRGPRTRRSGRSDLHRKGCPIAGPGEVLIKADAIGVNFIDTYFRSGMYPHELPFVPGGEVCGVAAVGDGVSTVQGGVMSWRHGVGACRCRWGPPHAFGAASGPFHRSTRSA